MTLIYNWILGLIILFFSKLLLLVSPDFKRKYSFLQIQISGITCLPIPDLLSHGLIILEDRCFYKHSGFDIRSIIRAIRNNLSDGPIQGASTIEQQLVRTLTNERKINYQRKLLEILLATLISNRFKKKQILDFYLNSYPFKRSIGIHNLCKNENYNIEQLTVFDISEIVARLKYPSITQNNYLRYLKRVRTVHIKLID